jgi:hypothetical protein
MVAKAKAADIDRVAMGIVGPPLQFRKAVADEQRTYGRVLALESDSGRCERAERLEPFTLRSSAVRPQTLCHP